MEPQQLRPFIIDAWHRTMTHYGIWLAEVEKLLGAKTAHELEAQVWDKVSGLHAHRYGKTLGFNPAEDAIPNLNLVPEDKLADLYKAAAVNWLAADGIWFQAVEQARNMTDAKTCNDNAWARYSPFEATRTKLLLAIPDDSGLDGLKKALGGRLYAVVNDWEITGEEKTSFVFRMVDCRVQSARERKQMDRYPCKSGGLVEHTTFASVIDSRIKTTCIGCPPDVTGPGWYCAWKFSI